jgi:hypothetical protein
VSVKSAIVVEGVDVFARTIPFLRQQEFIPPPLNRKAVLHEHCHQHATGGIDPDRKLLQSMGVDVDTPDSGCCGMAGAWGDEKGHDAVLGEATQDQTEECMAIGLLSERSRAREQLAVDEGDQRKQRNVLDEREAERKPPLINVEPSADAVESETEERAVRRMHNEPELAVAAAEGLDVRVVAAEETLVERLLQSPDRRRHGAGECGTKTMGHTLPACPKETRFIAPHVGCRCSSASRSRSRRRIRALR